MDWPADVLWLLGERKREIENRKEEVKEWCHMYTMWTPPSAPDTPTPLFLTFLEGCTVSPLSHVGEAQAHFDWNREDGAPPSSCPSPCLPSLHPSIPSRSHRQSAVSFQALFLSGVCRLRCDCWWFSITVLLPCTSDPLLGGALTVRVCVCVSRVCLWDASTAAVTCGGQVS